MATAVLDLDFKRLPFDISNLSHYTKALLLVRYNKVPVGQLTIPVTDGRIIISEHYISLLKAVGPALQENKINEYLGWNERNVINYVQPSVTVAVCTRDRPEDLRRCLDALMQLPNDGQEYIVIDNCSSTDETRNLVQKYKAVRYIYEGKPGLNNARNRALLEARHEIVAFTDDDAIPDTGWLQALLLNFNNPLVMGVTGLTMPLELETAAQELFERYSPFGKGFRRVVHSATLHNPIATGKVGAGANMALRRNVQFEVGFFDEALDAGTPTHSGGDHEMFARILVSGYRIVYDPCALNWHRHRRTTEELRQTLYGYGVGVYALLTKHILLEREFSALKIAFSWFKHDQLPALYRSLLRRPGHVATDLILAELRGCLVGIGAYFTSRKRAARSKSL